MPPSNGVSIDESYANLLELGNSAPLEADAARDATASIRGYVYQIYQSVLAWIELGEGEVLHLERAEDFDVHDASGVTGTQVKDSRANLTLRSDDVRAAIVNFWGHTVKNPGRDVRLRFLATAEMGMERGGIPGSDLGGLALWARAADGEADAEPLRAFLLAKPLANRELMEFLETATPEALRERLLSRIHWDLGNVPIEPLLEQIKVAVAVPGATQHADALEAASAVPHLLTHVAKLATRDGVKRLGRAELLVELGTALRRSVPKRVFDALVSSGALSDDGRLLGGGTAQPTPDSQETPRHGQITLLQRWVDDGRERAVLKEIECLREKEWAQASPSERFRALTVQGGAELRLGLQEDGGRTLLAAYEVLPSDPIAPTNRATGALACGDAAAARRYALNVLETEPDDRRAAATLIQANVTLGDVPLLDGVPSALHDSPEVRIVRVAASRLVDEPTWPDAAIDLYTEGGARLREDRHARHLYAHAVVDRAFERGRLRTAGAPLGDDERNALEHAADILVGEAEHALVNEAAEPAVHVNNAIVALRLLDRMDRVDALLDQGLAAVPDALNLRLQRAIQHLVGDNDPESVVAVLPKESAEPECACLRANALLRLGRIEEAKSELRSLNAATGVERIDSQVLEARFWLASAREDSETMATLLKAVEGHEGALSGMGRFATLRVQFLRQLGRTEDSEQALERLCEAHLARDSMDFDVSRAETAFEALEQHRPDLAAQLLGPIDRRADSPALRALCDALWRDHAYVALQRCLDELPDALRVDPYFLQYQLDIDSRYGTPALGATNRRELAAHPLDAEAIRRTIAHETILGNETSAAAIVADTDLSAVQGEAADHLRLCLVYAVHGHEAQALEVAYRVLITHWHDVEAHEHFRAMLQFSACQALLERSAPTVASGCVITLSHEGTQRRYRLEQVPGSTFADEEIHPDTAFHRTLIGRHIGERVRLRDSVSERSWTITAVRPVEADLMARSIELLDGPLGPESGDWLCPLSPDPTADASTLQEVAVASLHIVRASLERYVTTRLPLAVVAADARVDVLDLRAHLRSAALALDGGSANEVEFGRRALGWLETSSRQGCVVDALTIPVLRRHALETVVTTLCGPLHVTYRTLEGLHRRSISSGTVNSERLHSFTWAEGRAALSPVAEDQIASIDPDCRADLEWAREHATLVSSLPREDPSREERLSACIRHGWKGLDTIHAASANDLALLSEDGRLRALSATSRYGVIGLWMAPILAAAHARKLIDEDLYRDVLLDLALSGQVPVRVDRQSVQRLLAATTSGGDPKRLLSILATLRRDDCPPQVELEIVRDALIATSRIEMDQDVRVELHEHLFEHVLALEDGDDVWLRRLLGTAPGLETAATDFHVWRRETRYVHRRSPVWQGLRRVFDQ